MRHFIAALAVLLLCYAPVTAHAQVSTPVPSGGIGPDLNIVVPPNSPWWGAIAIGGVGLVYWLVRSYVDARLRKDREQFDFQMTKLRNQAEDELSDTRKTEVLAQSVNHMAEAVTKAYSELAQDRLAASAERKEFRMTLDEANRELARQAAAGEQVVTLVTGIATKQQAEERTEGAVDAVNRHTDAAHTETQRLMSEFEGRLDKALAKLDTAYASIDNRLGAVDDTIRVKLEDVRGELNAIKQSVDKVKGDTGELDASRVPAVDPKEAARHADVAPEPDIWAGDTPDNV